MLDREIAFYKSLHELGVSTTFVTFGNYSDLELKNKISPIKICCNKWSLPRRLYELLIPLLFIKIFKNAHLIKSNQLFGAKFARITSYIYNKPLIIRNGWMVSKTFEIKGFDKKYLKKFSRLEKRLFKVADIVIVTTKLMENEIIKRYSINKSIIKVIPNYINSTIFKPKSIQKIY